ncbi:hypothetical protein K470DRAFT_27147 [Piedraia hortae CBS 480.64]|uniref:Uncharacterized protein n=1 Tax=Piedraia hortae CBS 480.64 TaxID=1314780 RepID=A0A6A7C3C6_9PEZI|nr:hypothetical protein K470DRAFT_27147 [Piedraia hortae CBS 480.64]
MNPFTVLQSVLVTLLLFSICFLPRANPLPRERVLKSPTYALPSDEDLGRSYTHLITAGEPPNPKSFDDARLMRHHWKWFNEPLANFGEPNATQAYDGIIQRLKHAKYAVELCKNKGRKFENCPEAKAELLGAADRWSKYLNQVGDPWDWKISTPQGWIKSDPNE